MFVEVPDADVVDRITILEIKVERLAIGRAHAQQELQILQQAWANHASIELTALAEIGPLRVINQQLWEVEDELRDHEGRADFGDRFVELARSVYRLNDERASLKRAIGKAVGSRLLEQKSYSKNNV